MFLGKFVNIFSKSKICLVKVLINKMFIFEMYYKIYLKVKHFIDSQFIKIIRCSKKIFKINMNTK